MQTIKLVSRQEKSAFASWGLVAEGLKEWLDPATNGSVIAHDLLEHPTGAAGIGTVHDELMALGGAWYVRGQNGAVHGRTVHWSSEPVEAFAREVARQIGITIERGAALFLGYGKKPAKWRAVSDEEREVNSGICDGQLNRIADHAASRAGFMVPHEYVAAHANDALHYLRKGARIASERHGNAKRACELFWNVAEAVEPMIKYAAKGAEFALHIDGTTAACVQTAKPEGPTYVRGVHDEVFMLDAVKAIIDEGRKAQKAIMNQMKANERFNAYNAKMYGPAHSQRNVYKEARYA